MDSISFSSWELEALIECMDHELERMTEEEFEAMDPITRDNFDFLEGLRARLKGHLRVRNSS